MNAIRYLCWIATLVCGLLVVLFAIAEEVTAPVGVSSDIVAVIKEAPEVDQIDAARKFLEERVVPHFLILKVLGVLIVACSVLCMILPLMSTQSDRDGHETKKLP